MNRYARLPFLVALVLSLTAYASVQLVSGADSNLATVDANKNLRVTPGASTRPTFIATVAGATTTAAYNLQIDAPAATGIKILDVCVSYALGATTAGTVITTTIRRTTATGSGGTTLTNNGTGTTAITDLSSGGVAYGGIGRGLASTLGTAGATIDQWQFPQTVVAGTTGITPISVVCRTFGDANGGGKAIEVPAGTSNGVSVLVSAGGAGSLAVGSIRMTFIAE